MPQEEQVQGEATQDRERFREEIRKFEKCISEECFRWAIAVCMDIKREYWHYYSVCLGERETKPEITEDQCHERSMGEILRKYDFSKEAIMECIIS